MSDIPLRNRPILQLSAGLTIVAVFVGLVVVILGAVQMFTAEEVENGVLGLAAGALLVIVGLAIKVLVGLASKAEANINRLNHNTLDLNDAIKRLEPLVRVIAANSQISDAARSITHREREMEALRHAIREEMFKGNWEAANYLIDQMENRFGYSREADVLRKELGQVREMTIEEKIGEAVSRINKLMDEHLWQRAWQESERLLKLFPRHERVKDLPTELNRRRDTHKQELLKEWSEAVQREEAERGVEILTKLDQYLTREEAQQLQDSARHVFKAQLVNLGVQFGLAVSEQRWRDALEIGLRLRQQFPNSRMAQEVGEKIDTLRVRAGFTADTDIVHRTPPPSE